MEKEPIIIYNNNYKVDTNNVGLNHKLGLYGILGFLQDIASEHADMLGFGYSNMIEQGYFWVLTQQKLRMDKWPNWLDDVTIVTWAMPIEGFKAYREFEIFVNNNKIGECSTTWMTLDTSSRKPIIPDFISEKDRIRKDYSIGFKAGKVKLPQNMKQVGVFKVYNSDIDMNKHVNNTRYTKWILDSIPVEQYKKLNIVDYEINFTGETFLGDNIIINSSLYESKEAGLMEIYFAGYRDNDKLNLFNAKLTTVTNEKAV